MKNLYSLFYVVNQDFLLQKKSFVVVIVALLLRSSLIIICKASSASLHRAIVCSNSTARVLRFLLFYQRAKSTRREREGRKQEGWCASNVTSSLFPSFSASFIRLRASYPESTSATTAPTPGSSVGLYTQQNVHAPRPRYQLPTYNSLLGCLRLLIKTLVLLFLFFSSASLLLQILVRHRYIYLFWSLLSSVVVACFCCCCCYCKTREFVDHDICRKSLSRRRRIISSIIVLIIIIYCS